MNATELVTTIGGGVALLLWGVRMVRTGVTRAYGADLRQAIARVAKHRLGAFSGGLAATLLVQSSTATALILASFAGRGLIEGVPALAAMLGADVATSLVVVVLSFRLAWLSPLLLMLGVGLFMASDLQKFRHVGRAIIGLGLMLLALRLLVEASGPLREAQGLATILGSMAEATTISVIAAAVLTWLAHSSMAMVLLVVSLAAAGILPSTLALALVLGANVGSGITAVVATLGAPPSARRVPLGNLSMRSALVILLVPAVPYLADILSRLHPDPAWTVVAFHAGFNILLACVMLPLLEPVYRLCVRIIPDRPTASDAGQPRHLDHGALDSPAEALAGAAREALRMGDHVQHMLERSIEVFAEDDAKLAKSVEDEDDILDSLHEAIKLYLTSMTRHELDPGEATRHFEILSFTTNLEHIGDIIDKNLMELATKKIRHRLKFSVEGFQEIRAFHAMVLDNLKLSSNVFLTGDIGLARELLGRKVQARDAERLAVERHMARMSAGRADTIETSSLHLDIIRDLKRINAHLTAVAYPILERTGELRASRLSEVEPRASSEPA